MCVIYKKELLQGIEVKSKGIAMIVDKMEGRSSSQTLIRVLCSTCESGSAGISGVGSPVS